MMPVEFFAAWKGYDRKEKRNWDAAFWISQVNALRTTWGKEQARQIPKDKAPWDVSYNPPKEMSYKSITTVLDFISK